MNTWVDDQPSTQFRVTRQPCNCDPVSATGHRGDCAQWTMVSRFFTAAEPCPDNLIGQRIALASTSEWPHGDRARHWPFGATNITGGPGAEGQVAVNWRGHIVLLPLGCIVGSAIAAAVYPILTVTDDSVEPPDFIEIDRDGAQPMLVLWRDGKFVCHMEDQPPYADWTPGRYAVELADAEAFADPIPHAAPAGWSDWMP